MSITIPILPADLPEDFQWEDVIAPNGADIGKSKQHGYNYLMQQMNETQRAVVSLAKATDSAIPYYTILATVPWVTPLFPPQTLSVKPCIIQTADEPNLAAYLYINEETTQPAYVKLKLEA